MTATSFIRRPLSVALAAAMFVIGAPRPASAHGPHPSEVSTASALSIAVPVAVSVAAPAMVLVAGATLTIVAIEVSATGTVWVLERASDGVRASVRFARHAAQASMVAVGSAVVITALSTGYLLSAAGELIAFVPNQVGASLLHNERLTR